MCPGSLARGADEADAGGEGAAQGLGEGEVLRGVDVVVDDVGVGAIGDVFDKAAKAKIFSAKVEAPFKAGIEGDEVGEAMGAGFAGDDLVAVEGIEGETGMPVSGVDEVPVFADGSRPWRPRGKPCR